MMPLAMVAPGDEVRLIAIRGGRRMRKRLAELGLNPGLTVRVVQRDGRGPLILAVKDSRLALGRGMAHKIMVELT
jgi:Fe2+ transport system protein FeoA